MEELLIQKTCKYCQDTLKPCLDEGLECSVCHESVHSRCLKRGTVPGGLEGDLFFIYTCQECSETDNEKFLRNRLSWLQAIVLSLHHLRTKSSGLAVNGFFHWRNHIVTFIDRNWDVLFPNEKHRKKKWVGTVSGRLSHYSSYLFLSGGKTILNKPAWWTLMYPKITPSVLSNVYNVMTMEKQKAKLKNEKKGISDGEFFNSLLTQFIQNEDLTETVNLSAEGNIDFEKGDVEEELDKKKPKLAKRKIVLPNYTECSKKLIKLAPSSSLSLIEEPVPPSNDNFIIPEPEKPKPVEHTTSSKGQDRMLDPMCHYNTSINNISRIKMQKMAVKLTGGIRKEMILSPYSGIYLKPYIRRDAETFPNWLKLMAELQIVANKNKSDYVLPPRAPIDYTYVQPEHIPAINSLCNQFFWPGIDLTESLQYPDFSCVTLYKRLIIGFAFLVPDVKHTENYISFVFTRPGWRNCGIGKFMVYHLIQTSLGRDITLHVSIANPALFLYQKYGFKVENVVLDFYDKYFRSDVKESKHAFFCRLER